MKSDLSALATMAGAAARHAAELLRQRPVQVQHKGAIDLVTEIDLASEARIRADLAATGIPVQGEEGGGASGGLRWVVDPLDGTTNFVHGYPFYCVSIGLVEGGEPLVGAICDPVRDRLFLGFVGGGATVEGRPLRVSDTRKLGECLGVTGFPYKKREALAFYLGFVERVLRDTQGMRRSGSAAMDLATLSEGQADFFWEFGLHPWDTAAGALLVREAGGVVGCMDGSPWTPDAPDILAANPWIFEQVVALFREVGR